METVINIRPHREPWNKGKLIGQKAPLKLKDIWAIRVRLQLAKRIRELALFNLAIDSKLQACDLVKLRVRDVSHGDRIAARAIILEQKTQRPVQFEITDPTREAVAAWIERACLRAEDYLFTVDCVGLRISQRGNTLGSSIDGSGRSGSTPRPMARTPCGGRKRR